MPVTVQEWLLANRIAGNADPAPYGTLQCDVSTYAKLPSPAREGMLVGVTDSSTNTWGEVVAEGGSYHVLAYYDGTNWTVAAL